MGTPSSMFKSSSVLYCLYGAPDLPCADAGLSTNPPWGGVSWTLQLQLSHRVSCNWWPKTTDREGIFHAPGNNNIPSLTCLPLNTNGKRLPSRPGDRSSPRLHNAFPCVSIHDGLCSWYTHTYCSHSLYSKNEWRSGHNAPSRVWSVCILLNVVTFYMWVNDNHIPHYMQGKQAALW